MSGLAATYAAALSQGVAGTPLPADLETRLAALYRRGRAAHPAIALGDLAFARHLARCGAPVVDDAEGVHAEDLFLVAAALASDRAAVETLRVDHTPVIAGYLRRIRSAVGAIDDVEQRLWEVLLVGQADAFPKLASYSGKGQLDSYIGICAQRLAITGLRSSAAQKRALAGLRDCAIASGTDPELAILKERYRGGVEQALRDAIAVLEDRERLILRMLVVDGQTVHRIASVYGVNKSSVSRWLGKARQKVIVEARRLLRERLNVSDSEYESLANLVMSQLDLSVTEVLGSAAGI